MSLKYKKYGRNRDGKNTVYRSWAICAAGGGTFEIKPGKLASTAFNEIISKVGAGMEMSANSREADEATAPLFEKVDIAGYNNVYSAYRRLMSRLKLQKRDFRETDFQRLQICLPG